MRGLKPTLVPSSSHHFFATSIARWRTGTDLVALIKTFQREAYPFIVFYVPLPEASDYKIRNFTPDVEGVIELAHYKVAS